MNQTDIERQIVRALGRAPHGQAEQRLQRLLVAVVTAGGERTELGLCAAAELYERLMAQGLIAPIAEQGAVGAAV
jgi:hypothetical protein